jgi:hypothetical protein
MAEKQAIPVPKTKEDRESFVAASAQIHQRIAHMLANATKYDIEKRVTGADITTQPNLKAPANYHQRAALMRSFYDHDSLFAYLVDRAVHFASTKTRIRALAKKDANKEKPADLKEGMTPKTREEQEFWDTWSAEVNMEVDNTLPGIDQVKAWNIKNFMLDGMSPVVTEIGTMKVGKEEYIVPTKITTMPGALTILLRDIDEKNFIARERVFVNVGTEFDKYNTPVTKEEIEKAKVPEVTALRDFDLKKFKPTQDSIDRQYGFVVKYNHSPSDPSTLGVLNATEASSRGKIQSHGLYPNPPFSHLQRILTIRQQAENSDLAILDAIINQILLISVGDERHEIKPDMTDSGGNVVEKGTLTQIAEMITTESVEHMMQLILPYYVELSKIETNTDSLVKAEKYVYATLSLYSAFGIFIAPPQVREQFDEINRVNFEEFLDFTIEHHTAFMRMIIGLIIKWNSPKLSMAPTLYNLPTNTKSESHLTVLDQMRTRGEISHQTFLDHAGLNPRYEMQVIAEELASGKKDLMDENVPIQFVQQTGEGGEKSGGNKPGTQGGKKAGDKKGKTTGQTKPSGQRKSGDQVQRRPRKAASKE